METFKRGDKVTWMGERAIFVRFVPTNGHAVVKIGRFCKAVPQHEVKAV